MTLRRQSVIGLVLIFLIIWAMLFPTMDRSINLFDEGIVLTDGMLLRDGAVIHRDFYANYGRACT